MQVQRASSEELAFQPAARFEPVMQEVCRVLEERIWSIPGASVENNKFCVRCAKDCAVWSVPVGSLTNA